MDCHAEGRGFESRRSRHSIENTRFFARVLLPLYRSGEMPGGSPLKVRPGTGVQAAGIGWQPTTVQAMRAGGCAVV